jgi:hypothetical protein
MLLSVSVCRTNRVRLAPQRHANSYFMAARGGPREHQGCEIHAGHEQHQARNCEQDVKKFGELLAQNRSALFARFYFHMQPKEPETLCERQIERR